MFELIIRFLRTDVSGMPLEWVGYQDAVRLYHLEQVAYTCGTLLYRVQAGSMPAPACAVSSKSIPSSRPTAGTTPEQAARLLCTAAQQPDAVSARRQPVPVLRRDLPSEAHARPRDAAEPGRAG